MTSANGLLTVAEIILSIIIMTCAFVNDQLRVIEDKPQLKGRTAGIIVEGGFIYQIGYNDQWEKPIVGYEYFLRLLYASIAASILTIVLLAILALAITCKRTSIPKVEKSVYILLVLIWMSLSFGLLWSITIGWSENVMLHNYQRPTNWTIVAAASFCLSCCLVLDLLLFSVSNMQAFLVKCNGNSPESVQLIGIQQK